MQGVAEFKILAVIVGGKNIDQAIGMGEVLDIHWDLHAANFTGNSTDNSGRPDFGRRRRVLGSEGERSGRRGVQAGVEGRHGGRWWR